MRISLGLLVASLASLAFADEKQLLQEAIKEANRCHEAIDSLNNHNVGICGPQKGEKIKTLPNPGKFSYNLPSCKPSKSPLFSSDSPLEITVNGYQYDEKSQWRIQPAGRKLANQKKKPIFIEYLLDGKKMVLEAGSETRGKTRQLGCNFKPLRILLDKNEDRSGTLVDHIRGDDLKFTVHCSYTSGTIADHPAENQAVIKEYFQYKALKAAGYITPDVRLAKVTYKDIKGNFVTEGYGFFIEPKSDLAHRCGTKHIKAEARKELEKQLATMNQGTYIPFLFAEEIVQGWDWVPELAHNTIPLTKDGKIAVLAPYDFNDTTLVAASGSAGSSPVHGTETPEAWLSLIQNGPYDRAGKTLVSMDGPDKLAWQSALSVEAKRFLSQKEALIKALDTSPVADKEIFKKHYDELFSTLQKLVDKTN